MATVHVHVSGDPRRLLEGAAEAFLRPPPLDPDDPFASPPHVLLLRQGGLRDDLIAAAAARGVPGWFEPPLWVFAEIPQRLGGLEDAPVGDYTRVVLVERALREVAATRSGVFATIARPEAYVDALDRFFGELISEGVTPDGFEAAAARSPGEDAFERGRDADVAAVYRRYRALLHEAGVRDGRERLLCAARAIAAEPAAFAARLAGRREVRIAGLLDLKGGWTALLGALAAAPSLDRVRIYTSVDLPLPASLGAVVEPDGDVVAPPTAAAPDAPVVLQFSLELDRSYTPNAAAPPVARAAFSAPGLDREAEEVAARVRRSIDAGIAPDRIAIVARQARPAIDTMCAALERVRVPVTARRRTAFAEVPVVRAVLRLFAAAADGWNRHGLVELAEQPYLGLRLDATVLNHIGFRRRVAGLDAWDAALAGLQDDALAAEAAAAAEDEEGVRRERLPRAERVARARDAFVGFAAHARDLDGARPLDRWLDWLASFLTEDPWRIAHTLWNVPAGGERIVRLDLSGWRGMLDIVAEWRDAVARWGGGDDVLDAAGFERRLRAMLSGDVALWTETRRGVQVIEALAAAQRSFDHVFLVALDTERVPVRAPRSPILDEADRSRLAAAGLPLELRATWDARERALLSALETCARASLTLSYARLDASGAEVAASSFYEELVERYAIVEERIATSRVVTPGVPLLADAAGRTFAEHGARIEAVRDAGGASPWNGLITVPAARAAIAAKLDESFVWSPTQLEAYAKCPWAWFSGRLLHMDKLEDPDLELDPRTRGTLFHDALRRLYDGARQRAGGPVSLSSADAGWIEAAIAAAFQDAMAAAGDDVWLGHGALRSTIADELRRELVRYLEFEIDHHEKMRRIWQREHIVRTAVETHELAFDDVLLERADIAFRVRGVIDRVEVGVDDRADTGHLIAAVDYKSSKWSAPGGGKAEAWAEDVVLQVPLYAWVLTRLREGVDVARVEYRSIRQREIVHPLQLHQIERKTRKLVRSEDESRKFERAKDAIVDVVRSARDARFPAAPAPSCGCPDFCHAWEVCRVKDGPKSMFD